MKLLRHLPNVLTCGNLVCGCLGIISIQHHGPGTAAYYIWAAGIFDFLDGFVARALNVSSSIGKELDSLADMVSFGVLPAMTMAAMLGTTEPVIFPHAGIVAILLAVFSALRLAKFNIDVNQKDSFIGVPTPATAFFITALPFVPAALYPYVFNSYGLMGITIAFSLLMVTPFELFALKFKNFTWADNKIRFTFMLLTVLLLAWLQAGAVSLIILLYIAISLVSRVLGSRK